MPVSFHPKDQVSGGLLNDINGTLQHPVIKEFTYPNSDTRTIAIVANLKLEGGDDHLVFWSVGRPGDYFPCDKDGNPVDGEADFVESSKGNTGLGDNSNAGMLFRELGSAGFPLDKLYGQGVGVLDGLVAHWEQRAQPKREGLQGSTKADGTPKTSLMPTKVIKLPWDKAKPAAKAASAGSSAGSGAGKANGAAAVPVDASADTGDVDEAATEHAISALMYLRSKKPGKACTKTQWDGCILEACTKIDGYKNLPKPLQTAIGTKLKDTEFLGQFDYTRAEDGQVTIPAAE